MSPERACANCGSPVAGRYCGRCGQRFDHSLHSVWHFAREATEDLTHADSRLWRTLGALLLKPGFLTCEFLAGRRVRYLPPLRLYLVLSVVFFLVAASPDRVAALQIKNGSDGRSEISLSPAESASELQARPGESLKQREDRLCHTDYNGPGKRFVERLVHQGCANFIEDGGRTIGQAFLHNLPRAMFLFLPILALIMMAMYWHPRRYYVEHLLFFVHNHAFAFLLLGLLWLVSPLLPAVVEKVVAFAICLYMPYYLYRSMRRVYGQERWRTLGKLVVLSCAYFFSALAVLIATSVYSVLTL